MNSNNKRDFFNSLDIADLASSSDDIDLNLPSPAPSTTNFSTTNSAASKKRKLQEAVNSATPYKSTAKNSKDGDKAELCTVLDELNRKRPKSKAKSTSTIPKVATSVSSNHRPPSVRPQSASSASKKPPTLPGSRSTKSSAPETISTLFEGLCFYFLPNNIKNPVRKIKVQKSEENGAKCLFEWKPAEITHIVAEPAYKLEHVLRELKLEKIPGHIKIVKNNFPSDCIHHRTLQDPTLPFYTIPRDKPLTPSLPSPPRLTKEEKAKIKQRRREEQEQREESPTRDEEGTPPRCMPATSPRPIALPASPTPQPSKYTPCLNSFKDSKSGYPEPQSSEPKVQPSALDHIITDAKAMPLLDIDPSSSSETSDSDDETSSKSHPKPPSSSSSSSSNSRWQCMQAHSGKGTDSNSNSLTIELLSQLQQYYTRTSDTWRALSYRRAITTLKSHPTPIIFASDAIKLPHIGPRLAQKIQEIATTHHLRRLDHTALTPRESAIKLFTGIYGVGPVQAAAWAYMGYQTLEDIKEREWESLTESQKVGLDRYFDFMERIPREEVKRHGEVVERGLRRVDPEAVCEVMGSYRRGAETCGDVDMIITKQGAGQGELTGLLKRLTEVLTGEGFLKASLAEPRGRDDGSKFHGASCVEEGGWWRRIDFLIVPWKERGAALLYFTGNDIFNRSMRLYASSKGYRLNQRGIYKDVMRGRNREKITEGTLVESESEKV